MIKSSMINKYLPYFALLLVFSDPCGCFAPLDSSSPAPEESKQQKQSKKVAPPDEENECPMRWVQPGGSGFTGELPKSGETPFEWDKHPDAASYEMVVTQPDGTFIQYPTSAADPTQSLYMENYKQTGEYLVLLVAFNASGEPLCSIHLTFSKAAPDPDPGKPVDENQPNTIPPNTIPPVIVIPDLPEVPH